MAFLVIKNGGWILSRVSAVGTFGSRVRIRTLIKKIIFYNLKILFSLPYGFYF